jgi:hypothetical protein
VEEGIRERYPSTALDEHYNAQLFINFLFNRPPVLNRRFN